MGKDAPDPPPAPDPRVTIAAETEANTAAARLSAQLNRVNQFTPFGSRTYSNQGDTWSQTDTVDPRILERLYGEVGLGTRVLDLAGDRLEGALSATSQPFDLSSAPAPRPISTGGLPARQPVNFGALSSLSGIDMSGAPALSGIDMSGAGARGAIDLSSASALQDLDLSGAPAIEYGEAARDKAYQLMLDRLNPELTKQSAALDAKLAAQGLASGSEAYRTEQDDLATAQNKSRIDAFLASGAEADRIFGQTSGARAQTISERLAQSDTARANRGQSFAEQGAIAALANQNRAAELTEQEAAAAAARADRGVLLGEQEAAAGVNRANRAQGASEQTIAAESARADRSQALAEEAALSADARTRRADVLREQEITRGRPIAELAQLLSLAGGAPQSNFQGFGAAPVQPADALGAYGLTQSALNTAYQGQMANYNQQQQTMGGIAQAIAMALLL